jgi:beta-lactamase superfamily II metal-dependent hydrolase
MFTIEMLPAENGDCLFIEYGNSKKTYRVLVDGGTAATGSILRHRIERLDRRDRKFELLVVTHIDTDHIDGILTLLKDPPEGLMFDQIWFNGYPQISEKSGYLGALQGEYLGVHLEKIEEERRGSWNGSFNGHAITAPETGHLPKVELDGELQLTVMGPSEKALKILLKEWKKALEEIMLPGDTEEAEALLQKDKRYAPGYLGSIDIGGLAESDFKEDRSPTNGSSIVLLAEYEGHRCLLGADAFPSDIVTTLNRLNDGHRVELSAMKVPHHGSRRNNSNELYKAVDCERFLVSTNGKKHGHPNDEAIARILLNKRYQATLLFNYYTDYNKIWNDTDTKDIWKYNAEYPQNENIGLRLDF